MVVAGAPVTVTADKLSKTYGEADPKLTATVEGIIDGEAIEYTLTREEGENVGEYAITPSGEVTQGNYTVNFVSGTLTVAPKTVRVKADDKTKTYGDADPELTATVEGLVGEDTIVYTLSRTEGENVGEYDIIPAGEPEQGNYTVTYSNGTLTVEKRPIVIIAANESRVYDGYELFSERYSVSTEEPSKGLAEGNSIQSLVHDGAQTNVGECLHLVRDAVIVNPAVTDAEGNPVVVTDNYEITYSSGTLVVTKKPITITADSAEKVYDGTALTEPGYTSTDLADGDVFDGMTVTGSQTLVGENENVPSEAKIVRPDPTEEDPDRVVDVAGNYTITYVNGALKVTKRELTITADSAEKVYDGTPLTKETYTAEGLAEGDSIQTVTVTGSQTEAGEGKNVVLVEKIVNKNGDDVTTCYEIKNVKGVLKVTKKPVKLTAASGVQVYNGSEKTISGFTVSADGKTLENVTFEGVSAYGVGTAEESYPVTFNGVTPDETTDTTGNYLVTETEDGVLQIVSSEPLKKTIAFSGNIAEYTISVNPDGLTLNGGQDLTLMDTFTENQSIDYGSVTVSSGTPYDYRGFAGTFTIPDSTPVIITYKTRVAGAAGTQATFGNTAELGVMQDGGFASWYSATVSDTETITPSGTDVDGTDGVYTIKLFAYAQDHMERGLGGAVFRLLDSNQRPISYRAGEHAGEPVTFTTEANGYVTVQLDDGIVAIHKNTTYYLEMITAPVETSGDNITYYQKDNTLYRFLITDNPSYSGEYNFFNGDVLKVRCCPESAGINVTKRFSGNYTLTDEQKNKIRFVLQKEDLAAERWVEVESHTYAEFSDGSLNFNAGRPGGPPLERAVLYRLIEENSDIDSIDHTSTVTLTYQRDDVTVQENTNEFEVNPDHSTYSFSLVYDNTYVDHKLTIVKLNELTGTLLPGAVFTVYTASDDNVVKTYTTGEDGTLTIRFDDAVYDTDTAYYVVETKAPAGYLEPKNLEKVYFYFSGESTNVPKGVPGGTTAVNLTNSYDKVMVNNDTEAVTVPVTVTWSVDGSTAWPAGVNSVISLYQSVNGGEPRPVIRDGNPLTVTLNSGKTFDNETFVNLPARDAGSDISYSVVQEGLDAYYTSYKVSGTGWYVVRNESAVSVTVKKEWYDLDGNPISGAGGKQAVAFDLYRTTEDQSVTTRAELETLLRGETPVQTGLTLSADNSWTNTVNSLQKQDADGNLYYYYALEREDSMPRNNEDSYAVSTAGDGSRTLTVKNTQTPVTVIIRADNLTKEYGHSEPAFTFHTEVQDNDWNASDPVLGEDGNYTVTATKGEETKQITFTCSRETGEDVGSYAIELNGSEIQEGFRVRLDDGELTITPAQVTVKGKAEKEYGDPDPSLVEITGVKEGDKINYYAYRDIGEQMGTYRITVTGLAKQGNYVITYENDYLTIKPAPVTVTADNTGKAFGQTDPALTVKIDGLKNNDAASVIEYTISRDKQGTEEGESVGEYAITVAPTEKYPINPETGKSEQGNYSVTFVGGTFTISGMKVTVSADNLSKYYGADDPAFTAKIEGLKDGDTLTYSLTRELGEDVGTYVITPAGDTAQGNYEVTYKTGLLTINPAELIITPVNVVKALTDPVTEDPQLTVTFEGMAERDKRIEPAPVYDTDTRTWTYTYTREGKTEPEFAFTLTRTPGETAGPYIIAAKTITSPTRPASSRS